MDLQPIYPSYALQVMKSWSDSFKIRIVRGAYNSKFMKLQPVRAELFYADGRTERYDEANIRFSQLCEKRPKS
jgi:hypothetical protein